ncbi:MAG: hypothetical protein ACM3WS_04980 [Bacillota bacterium]
MDAQNTEFPKMLYKAPGAHEIHGGKFDYKVVQDEAELDQAAADGWSLTTDEAKDAYLKKLEAAAEAQRLAAEKKALEEAQRLVDAADQAPATKAQLQQRATELGIQFAPQWGVRRLQDAIAEKEAQSPANQAR